LITYLVRVDDNGNTFWKSRGVLHRENGPAIEWADGSVEYFFYGRRHRVNGPAVIFPGRYEAYWVNGVLHRENGPAVQIFHPVYDRINKFVSASYSIERYYYVRGKLHREDGPAIDIADGIKGWYEKGVWKKGLNINPGEGVIINHEVRN
jgi:hypothetical protein